MIHVFGMCDRWRPSFVFRYRGCFRCGAWNTGREKVGWEKRLPSLTCRFRSFVFGLVCIMERKMRKPCPWLGITISVHSVPGSCLPTDPTPVLPVDRRYRQRQRQRQRSETKTVCHRWRSSPTSRHWSRSGCTGRTTSTSPRAERPPPPRRPEATPLQRLLEEEEEKEEEAGSTASPGRRQRRRRSRRKSKGGTLAMATAVGSAIG